MVIIPDPADPADLDRLRNEIVSVQMNRPEAEWTNEFTGLLIGWIENGFALPDWINPFVDPGDEIFSPQERNIIMGAIISWYEANDPDWWAQIEGDQEFIDEIIENAENDEFFVEARRLRWIRLIFLWHPDYI